MKRNIDEKHEYSLTMDGVEYIMTPERLREKEAKKEKLAKEIVAYMSLNNISYPAEFRILDRVDDIICEKPSQEKMQQYNEFVALGIVELMQKEKGEKELCKVWALRVMDMVGKKLSELPVCVPLSVEQLKKIASYMKKNPGSFENGATIKI